MLRFAIAFLVIALIARFFGFAGVANLSWEGAKILFVVFLILAVLSFLGHGFRRRPFWSKAIPSFSTIDEPGPACNHGSKSES